MLVVPLALSAPGGGPDKGEEVVLAAGAPDGPAAEWASFLADVDADADPAVDATDDASTSDEDRATAAAPSPARARTTTTAPASTRAKAKAKPKTTTSATSTTSTPATSATAARVSAARAAVAPPPAPAPTPAPAPPPPPALDPDPAPAPATAPGADGAWDRLAVCESGNTNDHGAPYYGFWQFSAATWRSMGESGLPDDHSRERQLAAAKRLHATSGWAPWPDCSRRLGLR